MYPEKESSKIELKRELTDSFLKTVSAFANYDGEKLSLASQKTAVSRALLILKKHVFSLRTRLMTAFLQDQILFSTRLALRKSKSWN